MRTLYLKDSGNRRKEFALTTRICIENGKKLVIKEPCFPEGIPHIKRIVDSQSSFTKYYPNVEINKTWIENDKLYAEFIEGTPLSELYIEAIKNNDRAELSRLIKYHVKLMLGQNNSCKFMITDEFVKIFGQTNIFEKKPALIFTFFEAAPENIVFLGGDENRPCFIDYEWFFDFPIPVSMLKFRIAQQLSMFPDMDNIFPLDDRIKMLNCLLPFDVGYFFINKFFDNVYKEKDINFSYLNKKFEKNTLQYPDIFSYSGTLYIDTGNGYSENEKLVHSFTGNEVEIFCQIPKDTVAVRLDPVEGKGCVISNLEILSYNGVVKYEPINGFMDKAGNLVFTNTDPQIKLHGVAYWLKVKYRILLLSDFTHYKFFDKVLDDYAAAGHELDSLIAERDKLLTERENLLTERDTLTGERERLITEKNSLAADRDSVIAERDILEAARNGLITERDGLIAERSDLAARYPELTAQNCFLFFDIGSGYNEKEKQFFSFTGNEVEISSQVPKDTVAVRLDPIEGHGCVISNPEILSYNGIVKYEPINGFMDKAGNLVFTNTDPQIKLYGVAYWLKIKYKILLLSDFAHYRVLDDYVATTRERDGLVVERDGLASERDGLVAERDELVTERDGLTVAHDGLVTERDRLTEERERLAAERNSLAADRDSVIAERDTLEAERNGLITERDGLAAERNGLVAERDGLATDRKGLVIERDGLINSRSWRFTKPLREFVAFIRRNRALYLFAKGLLSLKRNGIKGTIKKIKEYYKRRKLNKQLPSIITQNGLVMDGKSFSTEIKELGGTVFCEEILNKWDADNSCKKILLVSHELNLTGAPVALHYFAENLQKTGKHPVVISPKDGSLRALLVDENIPVLICEELYVSDTIRQSASEFELVIVNTTVGAPIISTLNGTDIPVLWWIHEANASYHQTVLLAMPEHLEDNIHVYCGGSYAAVILEKYRPGYQCGQLLYYVPDYAQSLTGRVPLQINFTEGKRIFAIVGTQEERKGHDVLIQAIRMLPLDKLKMCLFVFVGRACYEPIMQSIIQICTDFPQNVQFIEELERSDLQLLYKQIDCLICASRDDPMPITVTEAMLMSKIIICSENTGSVDFLEPMNAGLIYRENSPNELAALIEFVIANRDSLSQMRGQARKTYERYFSQDAFNASVENVLHELLNKDRKPLPYNGTVSVIIPVFNAGEELRLLIELLKNQIGIDKVEIIIVDSGSKDGSAELAEELGAIVLHITQAEFSHSYARNLGAKNATGEYLLFMTQDALPTGVNWISSLIQPVLHDHAVAVSCRQIPKPGCDLLGRVSVWSHNKFLGIHQSDRILSLPKQTDYNSLRTNAQLDDVACLIRKDISMQFLYRGDYAEDLDLGIRLIQAGYRLSLLSSVQVIHSHTRPAVYHLKRCLVDSLGLKKIFSDFPLREIDAQAAVNSILTAYCTTIYLVNYMIETNEILESFSDFCRRIEQRYSNVLLIIQKMRLNKIDELPEKGKNPFDMGIQIFIQKLLACCNNVAYDPVLAADQLYYITSVIRSYLKARKEEFTPKFKEDICDLLVKNFGVLTGGVLAAYVAGNPNEKNSLTNLISEYSTGV